MPFTGEPERRTVDAVAVGDWRGIVAKVSASDPNGPLVQRVVTAAKGLQYLSHEALPPGTPPGREVELLHAVLALVEGLEEDRVSARAEATAVAAQKVKDDRRARLNTIYGTVGLIVGVIGVVIAFIAL